MRWLGGWGEEQLVQQGDFYSLDRLGQELVLVEVKAVDEFKIGIKKDIKSPKYKHFARGSKLGNKLLTRIRVGRSFHNQHSFTIGLADSPECLCHFRPESP
jgi:hypothetical protein